MTMATNHRHKDIIHVSSSPEPELLFQNSGFHAHPASQARHAPARPLSKRRRLNHGLPRRSLVDTDDTIYVSDNEDIQHLDVGPSTSAPKPQGPSPPPTESGSQVPRDLTPTRSQPPQTVDDILVQVLEVIPDVQPNHAAELIEAKILSNPENTFEAVLNHLFDDLDYPKVDVKGKRKRNSSDGTRESEPNKQLKIDYASVDRPRPSGQWYYELAVTQLCQDFRYIRKDLARDTLRRHNGHYFPAHHYLAQLVENGVYDKKKSATPLSKGKTAMSDPDFEAERAFLLAEQQVRPVDQPASMPPEEASQDDDVPEGEGIECGCCFGEFAFDKMIQCPDAHLFCRTCSRRNAEEAIGNRKVLITCMDQSGCKQPFSFAEISRFLPEKGIELWERLKAEKEINDAEIEGLEECPFCDFKIIIENEHEKLFRCANEECGIFSCRKCKKEDHLPKSCKEVEADRQHDARHAIEEAMTEALMRKCPKCSKAFVKEHGCNKMACPHCNTMSCYVCRQVITGYEHFNQAPQGSQSLQNSKKCPLWDDVETRHHDEVAEAARIAREKQLAANPEIEDDILKVDLPAAPRPQPTGQHPAQYVPPAWPPVPFMPPPGNPIPYHHAFGYQPVGVPIQHAYGNQWNPGPAIHDPDYAARRQELEQMQMRNEIARFEAARIQVARRVRRR